MAASVSGRDLVLEALLMITRDGEYSHIVLKNILDTHQYLDKKERAFITRVVNGTLERMIELDYIINQFSKVKVQKMKPVIRCILRSAVYQMRYMDSVPDSAICNEAVKLAVKRGFSGLKGFVNGVLRTISRKKQEIVMPDREDKESYLSVIYSLPKWLVGHWLKEYGEEAVEQMGTAFLQAAPTTVRLNLNRMEKEDILKLLKEEGVTVSEVPGMPEALYLSGYDYLAGLPSFREGLYQVQDQSSMQVAKLADPQPGDYVIDVCAAPGGKAIHMAELLKGSGHVEARDLTEYKTQKIWENVERSGLSNISVVCQDALLKTEASIEKADILIADLPCSGLGVLGRKPDLKYRVTKEDLTELQKLQRSILQVVKDYVKPGGRLVYSTCTINRGENEENAGWFAENFKEYHLVSQRQMMPGRDGGDGFYIAVFQKENHE